jgi:hypothetical protein
MHVVCDCIQFNKLRIFNQLDFVPLATNIDYQGSCLLYSLMRVKSTYSLDAVTRFDDRAILVSRMHACGSVHLRKRIRYTVRPIIQLHTVRRIDTIFLAAHGYA